MSVTILEPPSEESSFDYLSEANDPFVFKRNFKSIDDLYQQPRAVQDRVPMSQVVYLVRRDMHTLEGKLLKENKEIKQTLEEKTSQLETADVRKTHALEDLYVITRSLDVATAEYRPNGLAVIVQRHMDNARFALADGFMTVFPSFFDADEVLNQFDTTRKSVEWPGFQQAVNRFYRQHIKVKPAQLSDKYQSLWQMKSVFDFCSRNKLLVDHTDTNQSDFAGAAGSDSHLPNAKVLQHLFIVNWDKDAKKPVFTPDPNSTLPLDFQQWEAYLKQIFSFFVPAFIWAFHELKSAISELEHQIQVAQAEINEDRAWLNKTIGSNVPPLDIDPFGSPNEPDAADGSAAYIRKSEKWKSLLMDVVKGYSTDGTWESIAEHPSAGRINVELLTQKGSGVGKKRDREEDDDGDGVEAVHQSKASKLSEAAAVSSTQVAMSGTTGVPGNMQESLRDELLRKYGNTHRRSVDMYFAAVADKEIFLGKAGAIRATYIEKREAVEKALAILLDKDLMEFAVFKSSIIRSATNYFVHKHLEDNKVIAEALENAAQELIEKADIPKPEKEVVVKIGKQSSKLAAILYKGAKSKELPYSLESTLDSRLKTDIEKLLGTKKEKLVLTDFIILMKWFDDNL